MFKLPKVFYSPEDLGGGSAEVEDTFDALFKDSDDNEAEPLDLSTKETDKAEQEAAEKDTEKEDEDEVELTEEEAVVHTVPRKKEIEAEFPGLFKKYPAIEAAIYRDRQFTELFPTPADAKESFDKSEAFDNLQSKVMDGDTVDLFASIKDENPEAFKNVVDNLLVNLHSVDKEAYYHVMGTVASEFISKMVNYAKSQNNEQIGIAAQILNQFVFGTNEFVPQQKLAKQMQKDDETARERENFRRERFDSAISDVATRTDNVLLKTIDANMDPKDAMTPYIKKIANKEAFDELNRIISEDKAFKAVIGSMWKRVVENNFDRTGIDKIRSAYLSKAKTLLPKLIQTARNNAYKGMGKNVRVDTDKGGLVRPGRSATQTSGKSTQQARGKEIPAGMSSADYLLSDD